jgi:L-alanine-DL-glutamate epimerase-like enolase superfamily enzyme
VKIKDVTVTLFSWDNIPTVFYGRYAMEGPRSSQLGLVSITTDQDIVGHSFLGNSTHSAVIDAQSLVSALKPLLVGQNPLQRERLYHEFVPMLRSTTWRAIGAVDVALWDLAGKTAGLPIHQLMGSYRTEARAYVSSSTLGVLEAYVDQAIEKKEAGFTAYKIHPPPDVSCAISICRAIRDVLGPDHAIMLDPSWAFDYPDALRLGQVAQELNFLWYEDPLADDDLYNYVKLKQKLAIPIMATEQPPGGVTSFAPWIVSRATDFLRGDVGVKGGLTGIIKGAHVAEAFRMNFEVHQGGNSLNDAAGLHAIMAIKNCGFFEVLVPSGAQQYGVFNDITVDASGNVKAMDGPGLGAEIDFDLIASKTLGVLS